MRTTITDYLKIDKPLVIFDLETTGLTVGEDRIVEVAYEKIMPSGEIVAAVQRINPGMPIPEASTRITGITDEDVKDEPSFMKLSYEMWNAFEGVDVGGFNVLGFDLPFLRGEFSSVGKSFEFAQRKVLDAKILYHKVVPRDNFAPRNLSAAYRLYCGKAHETAHTGAGDVRVTVEILEKILEKHPEFRSWDVITKLNGQKKLLESAKTEHGPLVTSGPDAGPATLF